MGKTILVADDDRNIVEMLKGNFVSRGYNVITAYDGRTALDLIKLHRPDIAILDIMMPNIDGFTLGMEARDKEELRRMPIIFMTGETEIGGLFDKEKKFNISGWFNKPFNVDNLVAKVEKVISGKQVKPT